MKPLLFLLAALPLLADGPGVILSKHVSKDFSLTADPSAKVWQDAAPVYAEQGYKGEPEPEYRTAIRSRWSEGNLYLLYVSPYKTLYLKPNPTTTEETNKLWDWDVVEAFIGTDFEHIRRYKEFEVSPQGEWVDLDIDLRPFASRWAESSGIPALSPRRASMRTRRSGIAKCGFRWTRSTRGRRSQEMRCASICTALRAALRIAFTSPGSRPDRPSYHTPEAFGRLKLVK